MFKKIIQHIRNKLFDEACLSAEWFFIYDDGTVIEAHNMIVTTGKEYLARLFCGDIAFGDAIYLAMGTGTTAAALANTTLETEGVRGQIASFTYTGNQARLRAYFSSTEANGDWTEHGLFFNGTAVVNTGTLFNRLLKPISKTLGQGLTVEIRVNFE